MELQATGDTRHILRHHRTCELVVVTGGGSGQVISAYRSAQLIDALDCLIRGNWSEPGCAEFVRDNHDAFEELLEECYGEELDHLARWLNCL
jgi:hypothetical protein